MKQDQAELLVAAGAIKRAVLTAIPGGWELRLQGEVPEGVGERIHTARGGVRTWTTLDAAYRFLQSVGAVAPRVAVAIEGATEGGRDAA